MTFNFCQFYNETMNSIEALSIKCGMGTFNVSPRNNLKKVFIPIGIFSIVSVILFFPAVFVGSRIFKVIQIILKIFEYIARKLEYVSKKLKYVSKVMTSTCNK